MVAIIEAGRVCIIKRGLDFGKLVLISKVDNKSNLVEIEGVKMKKRKINILHLWPLDKVVKTVDDLNKVKI